MTNIHEECESIDDYDMQVVEIPINGVIDLHTFNPAEINDLLNDYINACVENSILDIRIIHGKGTGTLQKRVWSILKKHPFVGHFEFAPIEAGSWGATIARLKSES